MNHRLDMERMVILQKGYTEYLYVKHFCEKNNLEILSESISESGSITFNIKPQNDKTITITVTVPIDEYCVDTSPSIILYNYSVLDVKSISIKMKDKDIFKQLQECI